VVQLVNFCIVIPMGGVENKISLEVNKSSFSCQRTKGMFL